MSGCCPNSVSRTWAIKGAASLTGGIDLPESASVTHSAPCMDEV